MKKVLLSEETKENLKRFKESVEKLYVRQGKKRRVTYDEAVSLLIDCFVMLSESLKEEEKLKTALSVFELKARTVEEILGGEQKPLWMSVRNFVYLPDGILERIEKESTEKGVPLAFYVLKVLEEGLTVTGKSYYVFPKEINEELSSVLNQLPENRRKKAEREIEKSFLSVLKLKLKEIKKKLRRER